MNIFLQNLLVGLAKIIIISALQFHRIVNKS